ncbi:MAG TPA: Gfo/Idh/MocA family oxidoreductase [Pirellulaceae bacterium]|nr:Gfo/Idh/MocA family oxidoreductase [Pirellulaceae bacterium]HMO93280.1 Gfo/Idh/MocA family oxidoreductase [Pirellulaceae bacterium]HMP70180.1 Gfo/Idh/MocA family oxidoreductase [Pirellulaceae bacterium]
MLKVGIVGIGFMGWIHWLAYQKNPKVTVVAVSDTDHNKLTGDWTSIQGNFGPPGEHVDLSDIATYSRASDLLNDTSVDIVDICLPPALHADLTIKALQSGKHVFCEKPMALQLTDCDRMLEAARSANKQLMIGHVLPFFPEYQMARDTIASGEFGRLLGGHFKRVIADPIWLQGFYDPNRVGGPLIDLHVHDAHFIRMLFGMPKSIKAVGRRRGEVVQYCASLFEYESSEFVVSSIMGTIDQQGRGFTHGFEIHLEDATLHFEFAGFQDRQETMPFKIVKRDGTIERNSLSGGDPIGPFHAEIAEVINSIQTGKTSPILDGLLARDALEMCIWQDQVIAKK